MKLCPFCSASLRDEATFCLYCMRSLEEKPFVRPVRVKKQRRWVIPSVAGLLAPAVVLASVLGFALWPRKGKILPATEGVTEDEAPTALTATAEVPVTTKPPETVPPVSTPSIMDPNDPPVLRRDVNTSNGATFNMTIGEFKARMREELLAMGETEGSDFFTFHAFPMEDGWDHYYLGVGYYCEEESLGGPGIIGIAVFCDDRLLRDDSYVTQVVCLPSRLGSGIMQFLNIPVNYYDLAKRILGSETSEFQERLNSGSLQEKVYDVYTKKEIILREGDRFASGMARVLSIDHY